MELQLLQKAVTIFISMIFYYILLNYERVYRKFTKKNLYNMKKKRKKIRIIRARIIEK